MLIPYLQYTASLHKKVVQCADLCTFALHIKASEEILALRVMPSAAVVLAVDYDAKPIHCWSVCLPFWLYNPASVQLVDFHFVSQTSMYPSFSIDSRDPWWWRFDMRMDWVMHIGWQWVLDIWYDKCNCHQSKHWWSCRCIESFEKIVLCTHTFVMSRNQTLGAWMMVAMSR